MKPLATNGDAEPTADGIRFCREYAIHKCDDAKCSGFFVCGMQPFDADDLMHGVIVTREGLECHHHVEFEYYNNPKIVTSWFDANVCAYCAGSSGVEGFSDEHLSLELKSV
jgi:hypothetical protein